MTTPYIGEIQVFGFSYPPAGWALCNGATLQIRQYTALFSLIGTTYGGDGVTTFQLPNLVGRAACSQGQGVGLTPRTAGEAFGNSTVTLVTSQIPSHTHALSIYRQPTATLQHNTPVANDVVTNIAGTTAYLAGTAPNTTFAPNAIGVTGATLPHENRQPFLGVNFCIALVGEFPAFD